MEILVIDGQGGGLGRQLVAAVKKAVPQAVVTAIGTNSAATSAMLKAGADRAATGENAVVVGCRRADVILGPIGIVMADALLGEITPAMAQAVAQSDARRILIPANRCDTLVVGVSGQNVFSGTGGHGGRRSYLRTEGLHDTGAVRLLLIADFYLVYGGFQPEEAGGISQRSSPLSGSGFCCNIGNSFFFTKISLRNCRI